MLNNNYINNNKIWVIYIKVDIFNNYNYFNPNCSIDILIFYYKENRNSLKLPY